MVPKRRILTKNKYPQWILLGSQNSIANHPQIIQHTYSHTKQHTAKRRFCAEYPSIPTPTTSNSCLTPLTPIKQKAFVSCLGSNIYRPLSIESETSHDFKKSCLGQKRSGEAFSLSALDLTGKIKEKIRPQSITEVQAQMPLRSGARDADVLLRTARGLDSAFLPTAGQLLTRSHSQLLTLLAPSHIFLGRPAKLLPPRPG